MKEKTLEKRNFQWWAKSAYAAFVFFLLILIFVPFAFAKVIAVAMNHIFPTVYYEDMPGWVEAFSDKINDFYDRHISMSR